MSENESVFSLESKYSPSGDQPKAIEEIVQRFKSNGSKGLEDSTSSANHQVLLGVTGSGKTFTMANIIARLGKKTLIMAPNKTLAAQLYGEFREFFPDNAVEYFVSYYDYYQPEAYVPGTDTYIEKDAAINDEIDKLRHSATRNLIERDDVIVVSSVSCIYGIGSPEEYGQKRLMCFKGDKLKIRDFVTLIQDMQYKRVMASEFERGTFRTRHDIVEVFPAYEDQKAIRVEFFDDEIDSISIIDPISGVRIEDRSKISIFPSSHYVVGRENLKKAIQSIQVELRERIGELESQSKFMEAKRLTQRTLADIEMMEELGYCSGIENYSRHLTGAKAGDPPPTLMDFFGDDYLLLIDESHLTIPQVGGMFRGDRARKMTLVDHGFRLPSALDNRPLNFQEFEENYSKVLYVSATPGDYELEQTRGEVVEQIIRPTGLLDPLVEVRNAKNQVEDFYREIELAIDKGERVICTTLTKKLSEELTKFLQGLKVKVSYLHSDLDALERIRVIKNLKEGEIDVIVGINLLREGIDLPEVGLVGIFDADKEGFLRSTRSLIQIIGRAARNSEGRVVLYAYNETPSIREAMKITSDRRQLQNNYNQENNITPKTVNSQLSSGLLDLASLGQKEDEVLLRGQIGKKTEGSSSENVDLENLDQLILDLKNQMKEAASNLEFEQAAKFRDRIKELSKLRLVV